jgi:hypothetical protein
MLHCFAEEKKLADSNDPTIMRSHYRIIEGMYNDTAKINSTNDMTQLQMEQIGVYM